MRVYPLIVLSILVAFCCVTVCADDLRSISGVVVDSDGNPLGDVTVSDMWRANGSGTTPDGTLLNLSDEQQLADFWGNLGDMQVFPARRSITRPDGSFDAKVHSRSRVLVAMDSARRLGGISLFSVAKSHEPVKIQLVPMVTVHGRMQSTVDGKPNEWSHVYVELPEDPERPLSSNRIISCGSFDGRFRFQLPPGRYQLDAYATSNLDDDDIDLTVEPKPVFTIDGTQGDFDLGVLRLTEAPLGRSDLEASAKLEGRWRDFTEHYGEAAPNWHAVDARGVSVDATIASFRGKWLLVEFWGLSCAPCLSKHLPEMIDFYNDNAKHHNRFEVIGVCIDITGKIDNVKELDSQLRPIREKVWGGKRIPFPIVLDNTFNTWERFGIPGLGTAVLVDPRGNIVEGGVESLRQALTNGEPSDEPKSR